MDLSEFQQEEAGKPEEPKESSHQLAGKRREGFPSKALRGAKQLLSCLFLPPCCSGLDVVYLSMDLSEFQLEGVEKQEEAEESSHQLAFAVGSRQTLNFLMYSDDTVVDVSPAFPEVQFTGSEVRETNDHHLNFLVASDGDNASLPPVVDLSAEFAIVPTLSGRDVETAFHFHPYHLTTLVLMNPIWMDEPPFITSLSPVANFPTPIGRELQRQYQAYGSIIVHLYQGTSDEWEANQVIGPTSSIAFPETYSFAYSEEQNFFLFIIMLFEVIRFNLENSMLVQCFECDVVFHHCRSHLVVPLDIQTTQRETQRSDFSKNYADAEFPELKINGFHKPTCDADFPDCHVHRVCNIDISSVIHIEPLKVIHPILSQFHMRGKLSVAEMQIKEHVEVKEEVSKDLMQLESQKSELSREVEGLKKLVCELEDNTTMLMALLSATSQRRECILLAEKQVEGYAALNNEASENLKLLESEKRKLESSLDHALEKVKEKQRVFEDYWTELDIFMDAALEKVREKERECEDLVFQIERHIYKKKKSCKERLSVCATRKKRYLLPLPWKNLPFLKTVFHQYLLLSLVPVRNPSADIRVHLLHISSGMIILYMKPCLPGLPQPLCLVTKK